ncbi:hypothetical protein PBAC_23890 [Pedobacter glucosidilyticus]|nr:DUF2264 domain-containing protein [Pedobacter glucosidilyticus]KHJ37427.1 hypothetical protein PBAC_23890 [Pedobacter glucosidilyticus]
MKKIFTTLILLMVFNQKFYAQQLPEPEKQRSYMVKAMLKIADPVLQALSKNELKQTMPVEAKSPNNAKYSHLEAFGRTLSGIAPWLALGADDSPEGKLRAKYIHLAQLSLKNATDENAKDYLNFTEGGQPLVDAAFLAQGLLRAPDQLWKPLDKQTQANIIKALKTTRKIKPYYNNWLLFSATVEAALLKFEGSCDLMRVDYAIKEHLNWYKGDGVYGDGPDFHWDYYNSFVIHPMFLDVLQTLIGAGIKEQETYAKELKRAVRYAEVQERLIAPDGTYPVIGRSMAYRFGAFQLLSQIALMKALPKNVLPQQVRCALYTMVKNQIEAPNTFDKNGWLTIGVYGHQPELGETYISTGSLYLCSEVFLVLGLPDTDDFWAAPNANWTSRKVWFGESITIDKALKD